MDMNLMLLSWMTVYSLIRRDLILRNEWNVQFILDWTKRT